MNVKTKKYQFPKKKYISLALAGVIKQQWWVFLIYLTLCAGSFLVPSWWWFIGATIALTIYFLFWLVQFAGVTQLEQGKVLFEKLAYEINSQQILIKLNAKQGMPIKWDQIKRVRITKDAFVLFISKVQLIHWPHRIFNSENEVKFIETVLKRKNLLK
jgi:hypothetical protein